MSNGNRTGWSPIRSVIVRVINTRFNLFNHDYDYRPKLIMTLTKCVMYKALF